MSALVFSTISVALSAITFAFIFVAILRERCVPGTWRRYVYATIAWPLVLPALADAPFHLLFREGEPFWNALKVLNFVIVLMILRKLINDDDDNWWRQKRKQLRRYLRSFGLQPSPAGARS